MVGKVYLIGAGPGDPGLLTLKGRRSLERADVVVYDALVAPQLLAWAKPNARHIFVGKRGHRGHTLPQDEINALLAREARRGRQVARLKGGDPFLFGRGGEEAAYLAKLRIPYEVVPGVSSVSGVAAYAGIPLTDRHLSSMVTLVTGHEGRGKRGAQVEWPRISRHSTLVIFMGMEQLPVITERLLRLEWDRRTPVAVVRWATLPFQKVVEGTLGDIAAKARQAGLRSPALIVIGKVVALRRTLRWFETKPLFGRSVLVTRAAEQAPEFAHLLEEAGAEVLSFPTIQLAPPDSWKTADAAIRRISGYDWILFTSANGVQAFFRRLKERGGDIRDLKGLRIGAIGPKTSARLEALGLRVDVFPAEYRAEALAEVIGSVRKARVLLARAQEARDVLPKTLAARGAQVTVAPVYKTLKRPRLPFELKERLLAGTVDAVTFTSSSTVDGFMRAFTPSQRRKIFQRTRPAVIGPITAATLENYGFRPAIQAKKYTIESLAEAIIRNFQ